MFALLVLSSRTFRFSMVVLLFMGGEVLQYWLELTIICVENGERIERIKHGWSDGTSGVPTRPNLANEDTPLNKEY